MMRRTVDPRTLLLLVLVGLLGSSCAAMSVHPWDRDLLADRRMRLGSLENAVDDHIYFSKEGSTGGHSVAGGGCGCN